MVDHVSLGVSYLCLGDYRPFYSEGSVKRYAAMRCSWAVLVLWACCCTSNTRAQQCVAGLFPPLPPQPSYNGLSPTYDAIGALNGWYTIAELFVDALWPDIPYGEILIYSVQYLYIRYLLTSCDV